MPNRRLLALVACVAFAAHSASAASEVPPPRSLSGAYDASTHAVDLAWSPPTEGDWIYKVYRDDAFLGKTDATAFGDMRLGDDPGYVYLVTASQDGLAWGTPALVPVPTRGCEVVTVATSWDYPYVYVHLHEECAGAAYDKEFIWQP